MPSPRAGPGSATGRRRAVVAAGLGTMLEHFDLSIYGFLAVIMAKVFFPATDQATALLLAFATFGVAFVTRPVGAIVFGEIADRRGRKTALSWSLILMGVGSIGIAVMPTYEQVGIWATAGVIIARLIQGLSAGGEGAITPIFLAEQDPERRAGFASSAIIFSSGAKLLSSGVGLLLGLLFTPAEIESAAWRLPFLLGAALIPVAIYIRRSVQETVEFQAYRTSPSPTAPMAGAALELVKRHKTMMLAMLGINAMGSATFYLSLYLPTYAITVLGIPFAEAFWPSIVGALVGAVLGPMAGVLADRRGRFAIMLGSCVLVGIAYIPMFMLVQLYPTSAALSLMQFVGTILSIPFIGANAGLEAELFPVHARATATGLTTAIGRMLFGGAALMIFQALLVITGNPVAPIFFVTFTAAVSGAVTWALWRSGRIR